MTGATLFATRNVTNDLLFWFVTIGLTLTTLLRESRFNDKGLWIIWGVWGAWGAVTIVQRQSALEGIGALVLIGLSMGLKSLARQLNLRPQNILVVLLMVVAWGAWLVTLIAFPPALARDLDRLVTPVAAGFALLIGMIYAVAIGCRQRRGVAPAVRIALIALLLFLLPYVLWTQGAIPFYSTATLYALALTVATLIAGCFYLRRYNIPQASPTPSVQQGT